MGNLAKAAIERSEPADKVAKAAVKDAVAAATTEKEKEDLAVALYKEATGRFPQESSDRKSVYQWGFGLVGVVFAVLAVVVVVLVSDDKLVPDSMATLATALISGTIGGLFGYAKQ